MELDSPQTCDSAALRPRADGSRATKRPRDDGPVRESDGSLGLRIEDHMDGFLVEHPILSLDLPDEATFNFCSGVQDLLNMSPSRGPKRQTLLSEEAFNILKWRGLSGSFLPCPYFRPLSLGNLTVELLPSGEGCGSAFLHMTGPAATSTLYAHRWSGMTSRALRSAAPKPADHLLLRLWMAPQDVSHSVDKKELARFYDFASRIIQAGEWVVALIPSCSAMQVVMAEMQSRRLPLYFDRQTWRGLMALRGEGTPEDSKDGAELLRKLPPRPSTASEKPGLIILRPDTLRAGKRPPLPKAIWCLIGDQHHQQALAAPAGLALSESFSVSMAPDLGDIQNLVETVQPRRVTVSGPGAEGLATMLGRHGLVARAIRPAMTTLF